MYCRTNLTCSLNYKRRFTDIAYTMKLLYALKICRSVNVSYKRSFVTNHEWLTAVHVKPTIIFFIFIGTLNATVQTQLKLNKNNYMRSGMLLFINKLEWADGCAIVTRLNGLSRIIIVGKRSFFRLVGKPIVVDRLRPLKTNVSKPQKLYIYKRPDEQY